LNIEDANLRVRNGSVHAQGMTIGGATVSASHGLQSVSDTGNTTSNTLQFTNATTAFKATSNIELTANTAIVVESNVLMDFKTLGQIEFPGSTVEQEYPPGPMSGYETLIPGHGVFCASATAESNDGTYNSYEAFDGDLRDISAWQPKYPTGGDFGTNGIATTQTQFNPGGGAALVNGPALIIQFPHKVRITSYNVYARKASDVSYLYANKPKSGRVYGSNDGSTWTHVDTFGDWTSWTANTPQTETVTTPGAYNRYALVVETITYQSQTWAAVGEWKLFGTPGPTTLDKGSLTLGRSLDVPRISRYDVDTETPRPEKLVVDFDTTVNSSPTDISGKGNHGVFYGGGLYSAPDKAFKTTNGGGNVRGTHGLSGTQPVHSHSVWFKQTSDISDYTWVCAAGTADLQKQSGVLLSGNSSYPNRITFDCYNGWVTSTVTAELNRWYHVVATFNGGTTFNTTNCRIYVDGVDCTGPSSEVYNEQTFNLQGAVLALGSTNTGTRGLTGLVSNYKLYDVVLEPSEVRKLYNLGRTGRSMVISDTAVGIGKVPEAQLDVRGNLNVDGVITSRNFMFQASGPNVVNTQRNTSSPVTTQSYTADFEKLVFDYGGGYDTSTQEYTVPCSGYWEFDYNFLGRNRAAGTGYIMGRFVRNNSTVDRRSFLYFTGTGSGCQEGPLIGKMIDYFERGETVRVIITFNSSTTDVYMKNNYSQFYGKMLH
jgi:hypothetical protein